MGGFFRIVVLLAAVVGGVYLYSEVAGSPGCPTATAPVPPAVARPAPPLMENWTVRSAKAPFGINTSPGADY